ERVAAGLLVLAAVVVVGLWLAGPAVAVPAAGGLGAPALLAAIHLALQVGGGVAGAPAAGRSGLGLAALPPAAPAAHVFWGLPNTATAGVPTAAALDAAALALGAVAVLLNAPLMLGLGGSWRAWSLLLLALGGLRLAATLAAAPGGSPAGAVSAPQ